MKNTLQMGINEEILLPIREVLHVYAKLMPDLETSATKWAHIATANRSRTCDGFDRSMRCAFSDGTILGIPKWLADEARSNQSGDSVKGAARYLDKLPKMVRD
ncbi:hypothetical protein RRF57_010510 [Xylaria bambusicola]|uniref:Uncharacterized protein n=1 Tax=Xylaria bambusicola TaxID=326684 RepID=A0AAN7USH7_9PEZI